MEFSLSEYRDAVLYVGYTGSRSVYDMEKNIYKELEFHNFDEEWCQKHFLHIRALRQTRNILEQIKTYMNNINLRECEKF